MRAQTMREFQGNVERSSSNNWVRPIWVTTQLSLSPSIIVRSKSKTTTMSAMFVKILDSSGFQATGNVISRRQQMQIAKSSCGLTMNQSFVFLKFPLCFLLMPQNNASKNWQSGGK